MLILRTRNCEAVTCVDCSVTFYGDDYRAHNTCISEAEKYEKSVFQERKTKANPQQAWLESIESACSDRSLDSKMKLWLSQMLNYQNVPRNRKKFLNFCVNSLKLKDEMTALAAFEAISAYSKCSLLDDTANVIHHVPACRKRNSSGTCVSKVKALASSITVFHV